VGAVNEVTLEKIFLKMLRYSPVIIQQMFHTRSRIFFAFNRALFKAREIKMAGE
jgi:hypothetical protein